MPTTLTYGFKKPIDGERNFWGSLEDNITRLDAHAHDGVDSAKISTKNLTKGSVDIASGSWSATTDQSGTYDQTITLPTGFTVDETIMKFIVDGGTEDGDQIFPTWEKASSTTVKVYINDNTLDLKVKCG